MGIYTTGNYPSLIVDFLELLEQWKESPVSESEVKLHLEPLYDKGKILRMEVWMMITFGLHFIPVHHCYRAIRCEDQRIIRTLKAAEAITLEELK